MATEKEIRLKFRAETQDLKKNLQAAGVSADDAQLAVKRLTDAYKANVRESKKASAAAADIDKRFGAGIKGIEKSGQLLGGTAGQITGAIGDVVDVLEAGGLAAGGWGVALGAAGAAAVAAVGGVYLLVQAADALAESTTAAMERLRQIDGAAEPSMEAANAVREWDEASLQLEAALAALKQTIGAELLPVAADFVTSISVLVGWFGSASDAMGPWLDRLGMLNRGISAVASLGFSEYLRSVSVEAQAAAPELTDLAAITDTMTAAERAQLVALGLLVDEEQEHQDSLEEEAAAKTAAAEASREREAALREEASALERAGAATATLQQIRADAGADLLTKEQALTHEYLAQLAAIDLAAKASGDAEAAAAARAAVDAQYLREKSALTWDAAQAGIDSERDAAAKTEEIAAQHLANMQATTALVSQAIVGALNTVFDAALEGIANHFEDAADAAAELAAEAASIAEDAQAAYDDYRADYLAGASEMSAEDRAAGQARLDMLAAEAAQAQLVAQQTAEAEAEAAQDAFKAQQASAVAAAIVSAAQAAVALIPAYAYLGPGAPAAAALTAGIGLAAQLAIIASTEAPEAHTGLADFQPDEGPATLRRGESVLTPGATMELGPETIAALNAGRSISSGDRGGDVYLGRRLLGRAVKQVSPKKREKRRGVASNYRR